MGEVAAHPTLAKEFEGDDCEVVGKRRAAGPERAERHGDGPGVLGPARDKEHRATAEQGELIHSVVDSTVLQFRCRAACAA